MKNHTAFIQFLYSFYKTFIQFSYNFCTTFVQLLYNFYTTFLLSLIPQKILQSLEIQCFRQIQPDRTKINIPVFLKMFVNFCTTGGPPVMYLQTGGLWYKICKPFSDKLTIDSILPLHLSQFLYRMSI